MDARSGLAHAWLEFYGSFRHGRRDEKMSTVIRILDRY